MKPSELLSFVYTNSEEEVINLLKRKPELRFLQFTFKCLYVYFKGRKFICQCCKKLETFKSEQSLDSVITDLCTYIDSGNCQCFESHLNSNPEKVLNMSKKKGDYSGFLPDELEWKTDCAKTSVLLIASALGKMKLVKFIFPKVRCTLHKFWKIYVYKDYHGTYNTNVLELSPLHVSLLNNRFDIFNEVMKRCPYFLKVESYYMDTFLESMNCHDNCLTIAAGLNAVDYLNLMLKYGLRRTHIIDDSDLELAMCKALRRKAYECASMLADEVRTFQLHPWTNNTGAANFVLDSEDDRLFTIFLQIKSLDLSYCLQRLIRNGNTRFITRIIQKAKVCKRNLQMSVPFLIQAVLTNSLDVIRIVLACCKTDNSRCYNGYSALDWARLLGFKEAEEIIRMGGVNESASGLKTDPPLHAIFSFQDIVFDLSELVHRLVRNGQNVNEESSNGITPFIKAMNLTCKDDTKNAIIRILLQNGAEPFKGIGCTMPVGHRLLLQFLYYNVDVSKTNFETSLFKKLWVTKGYEQLLLLLRCAHTIPQSYKKALSFLHVYGLAVSYNGWDLKLKTEIDELLNKPQSLLIISRNCVRRSCGLNIHSFVESYTMPSKMKKLLILEDELS